MMMKLLLVLLMLLLLMLLMLLVLMDLVLQQGGCGGGSGSGRGRWMRRDEAVAEGRQGSRRYAGQRGRAEALRRQDLRAARYRYLRRWPAFHHGRRNGGGIY
uniref:Putative secreted peptide n=1 Tax=Anopheles braziliensis TaxID=58242 RepID=A0A2M3ZMJ8_9DIPT